MVLVDTWHFSDEFDVAKRSQKIVEEVTLKRCVDLNEWKCSDSIDLGHQLIRQL